MMKRFFLLGLVGCLCSGWAAYTPGELRADESAADLFERRILPVVRSEKPSSCTECHFGGVDLANYVRDDQATTFAALRAEGLIDVDDPDQSKILTFIARHTDQTDPLLANVRAAEMDAFRAWIRAAVKDPQLLRQKPTDDVDVGIELPLDVVRHLRRDRVLNLFVENIWSEMGRCVSCHSPEKNQRQVEKHGEQMSWIVPHDPAATLEYCVDQGLIDLDSPDESEILQKPLALVEHGGGPKFAVGSRTDKNFRKFLNDYAAVVYGEYERAEDLPPTPSEVAVLTGQHLRVTNLPQVHGRKLLRVDLYRWNGDGWSADRWATAENPINGRRGLWQSMVFAIAPRGSTRANEMVQAESWLLPEDRYLIKIYIDVEDQAKEDRDYEMGDEDLQAELQIQGPWPAGYQPPKIVHFPGDDVPR